MTLAEWSEIESDDQFQTENFCGGFDATEQELLLLRKAVIS